MDKRKLVFFDAECLVCNRFSRFLLRYSTDIYLAPIGGSTYKTLPLSQDLAGVNSILYWNGERVFIRMEALQEIGRDMGGIWKILARISRVMPRGIWNVFYNSFARIRYRILGKAESCTLIPKEYRPRLLNDGRNQYE